MNSRHKARLMRTAAMAALAALAIIASVRYLGSGIEQPPAKPLLIGHDTTAPIGPTVALPATPETASPPSNRAVANAEHVCSQEQLAMLSDVATSLAGSEVVPSEQYFLPDMDGQEKHAGLILFRGEKGRGPIRALAQFRRSDEDGKMKLMAFTDLGTEIENFPPTTQEEAREAVTAAAGEGEVTVHTRIVSLALGTPYFRATHTDRDGRDREFFVNVIDGSLREALAEADAESGEP